jgi:NADH:ubiquinone oxidoreductase subunit F (NADH-binding)
LILHNENQLRFPLEAARGIYGEPTSTNITCAFDAVKRAVSSGSAVDRTSRQSVVQVVSYDVESLKYMDKIAGLGPLSVLSDRLFRLYSDTLFIVQALQI